MKSAFKLFFISSLFSLCYFANSQELYNEPGEKFPPTTSDHIQAFQTDGCTLAADRSWLNPEIDWTVCCIEHDIAHWMGGSSQNRLESDQRLRTCVNEVGGPGDVYFWAVLIFGKPTLDFDGKLAPDRTHPWGYGWDHFSNHDEPTKIQQDSICRELQLWRTTTEYNFFRTTYQKLLGRPHWSPDFCKDPI